MKKVGLMLIPISIMFVSSCGELNPVPHSGEEYTLTLTFNNCTADGQTTYSHTYFKGEKIEPIVVTPSEHCILNENSVPSEYRDYWEKGASGSWVLLNLVITEDNDFSIDAAFKDLYNVGYDVHDHLLFTTIDDKPLENIQTYAGEDFKFKMKAVDSNDTAYLIPTKLDIYVGDSEVELAPKNYSIDDSANPDIEAVVTVFGTSVTDDIKINGKAVEVDYYEITADCYGVKIQEWDKYPYAKINEAKDIIFEQEEAYSFPEPENIFLCFDNSIWFSPHPDSEYSRWCTYDKNNHKLTIKTGMAKRNVQIKVRSPDYDILGEFNWKQINDYSVSGIAPYLFYVGEKKTVSIGNDNYEIRIIDFDRDVDENDNKIGITFEFANVIKEFKEIWDRVNNHDFRYSVLKQQFEPGKGEKPGGYIYEEVNKIVDEDGNKLTKFIKTVKKDVETYGVIIKKWQTETYSTKLFPLSRYEIDGKNTSYQYYKNADRSRRKKDNTDYWLRSPSTSYDDRSWYVYAGGSLGDYGSIYNDAKSVAPVFCI